MNKELKEQAKEIMCANLIAFEETTPEDKKAELRPKVILENLDSLIDKTVQHERERIVKMIEKHKQNACVIADYPAYDETNMTRFIENPLLAKIVYQHIDFVRELQSLITNKSDINSNK